MDVVETSVDPEALRSDDEDVPSVLDTGARVFVVMARMNTSLFDWQFDRMLGEVSSSHLLTIT
jgi:hypothetical protein